MQITSLRWVNTVGTIYKKWIEAEPYRHSMASQEFECKLFHEHNRSPWELYSLLKRAIPLETELTELLDKLGKWFTSRERWSGRAYRKMVVRSTNRYFNDPRANRQLQLLAIVVTHEFNTASSKKKNSITQEVSQV